MSVPASNSSNPAVLADATPALLPKARPQLLATLAGVALPDLAPMCFVPAACLISVVVSLLGRVANRSFTKAPRAQLDSALWSPYKYPQNLFSSL